MSNSNADVSNASRVKLANQKHANNLKVVTEDQGDQKLYQPQGSLFFGSTTRFLENFDFHGDPQNVVIDFKFSKVCDHSGLEAIDTIVGRYHQKGKSLAIRNLSADCSRILNKRGGYLPRVSQAVEKS